MKKILFFVPMATNQTLADRIAPMSKLVRDHFSQPVKALEIGTWFGLGSTQVWLQTLPKGSNLTLIDAWRPYLSQDDLESGSEGYRAMNMLTHAAVVNTLEELYKAESSSHPVTVDLVRALAADFMAKLEPEVFDFIYVDGSHYYHDVKRDIHESKRLLKNSFSILCGDDLEVAPSEDLIEFAKAHVAKDWVYHPNGIGFHPGVLLAVHEELGKVNLQKGFWWVFKRNGEWSI